MFRIFSCKKTDGYSAWVVAPDEETAIEFCISSEYVRNAEDIKNISDDTDEFFERLKNGIVACNSRIELEKAKGVVHKWSETNWANQEPTVAQHNLSYCQRALKTLVYILRLKKVGAAAEAYGKKNPLENGWILFEQEEVASLN